MSGVNLDEINFDELDLDNMTLGECLTIAVKEMSEHSKGNHELRSTGADEMSLGEKIITGLEEIVEHRRGNLELRTHFVEIGEDVPHEDVLELAEV
ncbi:MAG: hypothetical protein FWG65_10585 [Turicibacter sp.]|nr:hypothetical protein [Turicibacter sp.]